MLFCNKNINLLWPEVQYTNVVICTHRKSALSEILYLSCSVVDKLKIAIEP